MRSVRVCIYGGTDLDGAPTEFISDLAYGILESMDAVIVTGGSSTRTPSPTRCRRTRQRCGAPNDTGRKAYACGAS